MSLNTGQAQAQAYAMRDGFNMVLAERLRKQFEAVAKPFIDAAIKEALDHMKLTVETYHQPQFMRDTVNLILTDKRENETHNPHRR